MPRHRFPFPCFTCLEEIQRVGSAAVGRVRYLTDPSFGKDFRFIIRTLIVRNINAASRDSPD